MTFRPLFWGLFFAEINRQCTNNRSMGVGEVRWYSVARESFVHPLADKNEYRLWAAACTSRLQHVGAFSKVAQGMFSVHSVEAPLKQLELTNAENLR